MLYTDWLFRSHMAKDEEAIDAVVSLHRRNLAAQDEGRIESGHKKGGGVVSGFSDSPSADAICAWLWERKPQADVTTSTSNDAASTRLN